jgi:hypothetical protein
MSQLQAGTYLHFAQCLSAENCGAKLLVQTAQFIIVFFSKKLLRLTLKNFLTLFQLLSIKETALMK